MATGYAGADRAAAPERRAFLAEDATVPARARSAGNVAASRPGSDRATGATVGSDTAARCTGNESRLRVPAKCVAVTVQRAASAAAET
jgi:hypothetical protein